MAPHPVEQRLLGSRGMNRAGLSEICRTLGSNNGFFSLLRSPWQGLRSESSSAALLGGYSRVTLTPWPCCPCTWMPAEHDEP